MKKILIGIPVFNCEDSLQFIIEDIQIHRKKLTKKYSIEVLYINDGSTDSSLSILKNKNCWVISHKSNLGLGVVLQRIIKEFNKKDFHYLVTLDGDGQHLISHIEKVIKKLEMGFNLVLVSRFLRNKEYIPIDRILLNTAVKAMLSKITNLKVSDPLTGFKGYSRIILQIYKEISLTTNGYCSCIEELLYFYLITPELLNFTEISQPPIYQSNNIRSINSKYLLIDYEKRNKIILDAMNVFSKFLIEKKIYSNY